MYSSPKVGSFPHICFPPVYLTCCKWEEFSYMFPFFSRKVCALCCYAWVWSIVRSHVVKQGRWLRRRGRRCTIKGQQREEVHHRGASGDEICGKCMENFIRLMVLQRKFHLYVLHSRGRFMLHLPKPHICYCSSINCSQ